MPAQVTVNATNASPEPRSQGVEWRERMLAAGAPAEEVDAWALGLHQKMIDAGAPVEEVNAFWGQFQPDTRREDAVVRANMANVPQTEKERIVANDDYLGAFDAGLQLSTGGLAARGKAPDVALGPDAGLGQQIAAGAGQLLGDIPAGVAGGVSGFLTTGPLGAVVGGVALPASLRQMMMDHYKNPEGSKTWEEVFGRVSHSTWEIAKETVSGVVGYKVGQVVAGPVLRATGSKIAETAASLTGMTVASTGVIAGMEGRVPTANDFVVAGVLAAGAHVAVAGAGKIVKPGPEAQTISQNLRDIYERNGIDPYSVIQMAMNDPVIRQEVLAPRDAFGELATPALDAQKLPEPKTTNTYKPELRQDNTVVAPPKYKPEEPKKAIVKDKGNGDYIVESNDEQRDILSLYEKNGAMKVGMASVSQKGQGRAVALYEEALDFAGSKGMVLRSDFSVSTAAMRVYEGLKRRGYEVTTAEGSEPNKAGITNTGAGYVYEVKPKKKPEVDPEAVQRANDITAKDPRNITGSVDPTMFLFEDAARTEHIVSATFTVDGKTFSDPRGHMFAMEKAVAELKLGGIDELVDRFGGIGPKYDAADGFLTSTGRVVSRSEAARIQNRAGTLKMEDIPSVTSPEQASKHGYDASRLADPQYDADVTKTVVADLNKQFVGNTVDMLVGHKLGVEGARIWIEGGRVVDDLPIETQRFLQRAEDSGLLDQGINDRINDRVLTALEKEQRLSWPMKGMMHEAAVDTGWRASKHWKNTPVVSINQLGDVIPAPEAIAFHLKRIANEMGIGIMVGPPQHDHPGGRGGMFPGEASPNMQGFALRNTKTGAITPDPTMSYVYIPDTADTLYRRWYGLGTGAVLFHELGHAIDQMVLRTVVTHPDPAAAKAGRGLTTNDVFFKAHPAMHAEIIAASQRFRPQLWQKNPTYNMTAPELMADAVAVWLSDPTERARMPTFGAMFGKQLEKFVEMADRAMPARRGADGTWEDNPKFEGPKPPGAGHNSAGAGQDEPGAGGAGGGKGGPPGPPVGTGMGGRGTPKKPAQIEDNTMKLTEGELVERINERVAPEMSQGLVPDWLNPRKHLASFQSQLMPARPLDRKVDAVFGPRGKTRLGVEDMMRQTYGSSGRADHFLKHGTLDAMTLEKTSDASYVKAYAAVEEDGGTVAGFQAYRLAARTLEKAEQGVETGVDMNQARRLVQLSRAKYERGVGILREVKDSTIDYATDSGVWSGERAVRMKEANREHIVMRRIIDDTYNPPRPGKGFRVRQPVKTMEGSDRMFVDPNTADVDNVHTIVAMADRNRAMGNIIGIVEEYNRRRPLEIEGGMDIPFYKMEGPDGEINVGKYTLLDELGNVIPEKDRDAYAPFIAEKMFNEKWRASARAAANPDAFLYFREGKPEVWVAKDPDLAAILRVNWTGGGKDPLPQFMSKFANLQRVGIAASPSFMLRSLHIGQLTAFASAEGGGKPYVGLLDAMHSVWHQDEVYQQWLAKGGFSQSIADIDNYYLHKSQAKIFEETGNLEAAWNVVRHPLDALRAVAQFADSSSRLQHSTQSQKRDYTPEKAAMLSRKAQLDYAEAQTATWVNTWARQVPFMTTGIKDIEQVAQAIKDHPMAFGAGAMTVFFTPTLMNYALNWAADQFITDDKDKYSNVDRWQKDIYWVLPPINGVRMKIPKGIGPTSFMFSTVPERFFDWLVREQPDAANGFFKAAVNQVLPPYMPTFLNPIYDQATNSVFSGKPLIPAALEKNSGPMQYRPDTTEVAKALAKVTGFITMGALDSPIVVENYVKQWLGTVPMDALRVLDPLFEKDMVKPGQLSDIPFVGAFIMRNPQGGQMVENYYTELRRVTTSRQDFKRAVENNNIGEIKSFAVAQAFMKLDGYSKALRAQTTVINAIYRDKTMTNDEKRKHVDGIYSGMVQTAKSGIAVMRSLDKTPAATE